MSWPRHYGLEMALCHQVLLYKIHTQSWYKVENAVMVVRNSKAYPRPSKRRFQWPEQWQQPLCQGHQWRPSCRRGGNELQDHHTPKLTVRQRQRKLFDEQDLSGLDRLPLELADATCWLLAEYHNVFSLDPVELGCTHSTEHTIKVTDDTPFKKWFRQIPLPLVKEVQNHLQEMLGLGAIWPSQNAWCNAVVLVRKKDGGLQFCINFCCLNAHMKKDSSPLPRIQEVLESLVGAGHFSCLGLKLGFWQIKMEEASKQYTTFTVGNLGFFKCDHIPFGLCNVLATFQRLI